MRLLPSVIWRQSGRVTPRNKEASEDARRTSILRGLLPSKLISDENGLSSASIELRKKDKPLSRSYRRRDSSISLVHLPEDHQAKQKRKKYCEQTQSRFFEKLPGEIRVMIYEYVAGPGHTVHLTLGGRPLRYGQFVCCSNLDSFLGIAKRLEEANVPFDEATRRCTCTVLVGGSQGACAHRIANDLLKWSLTCRKS